MSLGERISPHPTQRRHSLKYKSLTAIILEEQAANTALGAAIRLGEALATDPNRPRTVVVRQQPNECAFVFDVRTREELLWAECRGRKLERAVLVWASSQGTEEVERRVRLLTELMADEGGEVVLRFDPETPQLDLPQLIFTIWDVVAGMSLPPNVTLKIDGGLRGEGMPERLLCDSQFPMDTIPSPPRFDSSPLSGVRMTRPEQDKQDKDSEEAA